MEASTKPVSAPIRLASQHVPSAAAMFARAFQDDPLYGHFFPDPGVRRRILPTMFRFRLNYGMMVGEVYATSLNLESVAIWIPSQNDRMTLPRLVRTGGLGMFLAAGSDARKRMQAAIKWAGAIKAKHASFLHWHLSPIATEPAQQRKGYAAILIRNTLARFDAERVPCFLETQTERNAAIYEHYGFKTVENAVFPGTNVNHWAMLRMPPGVP